MADGYGKGTFFETRYLLSPAFISLGVSGTSAIVSSCSTVMLLMFLCKRQFKRCPGKKGIKEMMRVDENKLSLTYKELARYGISKTRAARGFSELLAKGFIKVEHQGGAFEKDKSLYSLSTDFIRWRPGDAPIQCRSSDVRRGFLGKGKGIVSVPKKQLSHMPTIPTHAHADDTHPGKRRTRT
ncbi:MAG: hypothetical protein AB1656_18170 [Candidatus Omnitrophota bacterium]